MEEKASRKCCVAAITGTLTHLHQMCHGIFEEHHVHACSSDRFVVLQHKEVESVAQLIKRLDLNKHIARLRNEAVKEEDDIIANL